MNGAQAPGCSPVAHGLRRGHRRLPPGQARHDRQVAGDRQPGRRPVRDRAGQRTSGGGIDAVTDDEIRAGIRLLAETTGIFTETAGGVTTATLAKLADARRHRPRRARRARHHRRGPQDARRGARHVRGPRDRRRRSTQFDEQVEAGVTASDGRHGQAAHAAARRRRRRSRRSRSRARPSARCSRRFTPSTASCATASCDGDGGLRRFVNVYVDGEDVRTLDGLETPVREGGQLTILPAVAGG